MMRVVYASLFALIVTAPFVAHADADSYSENQSSRAESARLYPHPVNSSRARLAFIKALTQTRVVESYTRVGVRDFSCGNVASVIYVYARLVDGRVCVSPAPTSCESRTVSCE